VTCEGFHACIALIIIIIALPCIGLPSTAASHCDFTAEGRTPRQGIFRNFTLRFVIIIGLT